MTKHQLNGIKHVITTNHTYNSIYESQEKSIENNFKKPRKNRKESTFYNEVDVDRSPIIIIKRDDVEITLYSYMMKLKVLMEMELL